jgi:hypothetical protein
MSHPVFLKRAQLDQLRRVAAQLYREDLLSSDQMRELAHAITEVADQAADDDAELPPAQPASSAAESPASPPAPGEPGWISVVQSTEAVVVRLHALRGDAGRACFTDVRPESTSGYVAPVARRRGSSAEHVGRDYVVACVAIDPELRRALTWASDLRGEVRSSDLAYALAQAVSALATRLVAEYLQGR